MRLKLATASPASCRAQNKEGMKELHAKLTSHLKVECQSMVRAELLEAVELLTKREKTQEAAQGRLVKTSDAPTEGIDPDAFVRSLVMPQRR